MVDNNGNWLFHVQPLTSNLNPFTPAQDYYQINQLHEAKIMIEDPSDELMDGMWIFLKRILIILVPFWVYLLAWSAGAPIIVAAILAGLSVAPIAIYENLKLKEHQDEK